MTDPFHQGEDANLYLLQFRDGLIKVGKNEWREGAEKRKVLQSWKQKRKLRTFQNQRFFLTQNHKAAKNCVTAKGFYGVYTFVSWCLRVRHDFDFHL